MNLHVNQEEMRQKQHAVAVRNRLFNSPVAAQLSRKPLEEAKATISALEEQVSKLNKALAGKDEAIKRLEIDMADRDARILYLAERLETNQVEYAEEELQPAPTKRKVADIVAEVLRDFPGVTWDHVVGVRRSRHLIEPRHRAMVAVYDQRPDLSLPMIGKIFHRDHSVILHAVDKFGPRRDI